MGKMLLGMAAVVAIGLAAPAAAGSSNDGFSIGGGQGFVSAPGPGGPRDRFRFNGHNGHNGDRRRGDDIGLWVNGGEWARWNNQSWQSDSFNDWWHDRPDRAYPAWVRNNQMMQSCRLYYSGGGWRC